MDQQNTIQQQYPLSPRKFWKKVIAHTPFIFFIDLFVVSLTSLNIISNDIDNTTALIFIPIYFIFIMILHTLLYMWYVKVYIRSYYYDANQDFITIKKGFFAPTEINVQWKKIQDVYVDQDILDRIMGLYDVHIASATMGSSIEAHIDGVDKMSAEGLKKLLLDKISNNNHKNEVLQQTSTTQDISQIQSVPQNTKINLNQEVSSNNYPLTGKWLTLTLFSRLASSFIFPGFLILLMFGKMDDLAIFDNWLYIILVWLALGVLTMITRIVILFLWRSNYAFNFTEEHIYFREGVISISEKHMPYSSIQDVVVHQGVLERLFGLAKVKIENASPQMVLVGRRKQVISAGVLLQGLSLNDANKIANIIKNTVLGKNGSHYGV